MKKFIVLVGVVFVICTLETIDGKAAEDTVTSASGDIFDPNSEISHQDILEGYYIPVEEVESNDVNAGIYTLQDDQKVPLPLVDAWSGSKQMTWGKWYECVQDLDYGNHYNTFAMIVPEGVLQYRYHYTLAKESGYARLHRRHVTAGNPKASPQTTYFDEHSLDGQTYNLSINMGDQGTFSYVNEGTQDEPLSLPDQYTAKSVINNDDNIDAAFNFQTRWTKGFAGCNGTTVKTYHVHCKIWQEHASKQHDKKFYSATHIRIMIN